MTGVIIRMQTKSKKIMLQNCSQLTNKCKLEMDSTKLWVRQVLISSVIIDNL